MIGLTTIGAVVSGFSPWRIVGVLLVLAALVGLGAWGGHTLARNHYEPLLSEANKQIGTLTTANTAMKTSVERQNAAVTALEAEAKKREQDAVQAVSQPASNRQRAKPAPKPY